LLAYYDFKISSGKLEGFNNKIKTMQRQAYGFRDQESATQRGEYSDLAIKAFELSQSLTEKWAKADYQAKRQILEIICLNFSLNGVTLVPTIRKPFDVLAEGLLLGKSRGDWRKFEPCIGPFVSVFAYALPPYLERAARFVS